MAFNLRELTLLRVDNQSFKGKITAQDVATAAGARSFCIILDVDLQDGQIKPGRGQILLRDRKIAEQLSYEAFSYSLETKTRIIRDLGIAFPWELAHLNYWMSDPHRFCKELFVKSEQAPLGLDALTGLTLPGGLIAMHSSHSTDALHFIDGVLQTPLPVSEELAEISFIAYPSEGFLDAKLKEAQQYDQQYGDPGVYLTFLMGMNTLELPQLAQAWTRTLEMLEQCSHGESFIQAARFAASVLNDSALEEMILEKFQAGVKAQRIDRHDWMQESQAKIEAQCLILLAEYVKSKKLSEKTKKSFEAITARIVELFGIDSEQVVEPAQRIVEILTEINPYKSDWSSIDLGRFAREFAEQIINATSDKKLKTKMKGRFKKVLTVYDESVARIATAKASLNSQTH